MIRPSSDTPKLEFLSQESAAAIEISGTPGDGSASVLDAFGLNAQCAPADQPTLMKSRVLV